MKREGRLHPFKVWDERRHLSKTMKLKSGFILKLLLSSSIAVACLILSDLFATIVLNRPEMGSLIIRGTPSTVFIREYQTHREAVPEITK